MKPRRSHRNRRGAAAVEFGLVLPVLLMILLGIIDYGWVFFNQLQMTNAVREGARAGVVVDDPVTALNTADAVTKNYLTAGGIDLTNVTISANFVGGSDVQVTATQNPFQPLVGFVPTPAQLNATAAMRWELAP